jgi:hypothetical protein
MRLPGHGVGIALPCATRREPRGDVIGTCIRRRPESPAQHQRARDAEQAAHHHRPRVPDHGVLAARAFEPCTRRGEMMSTGYGRSSARCEAAKPAAPNDHACRSSDRPLEPLFVAFM